jgi:hypothetical protein
VGPGSLDPKLKWEWGECGVLGWKLRKAREPGILSAPCRWEREEWVLLQDGQAEAQPRALDHPRENPARIFLE